MVRAGEDGLDREFEADELSVLLSLRSLDESAGFLQRATAAAGPFLFLALDHLVTRVRDEVYELPDGLVTTPYRARCS